MCVNTGCNSCNGDCGCTCNACCNNDCNNCCDPCNEQPCGCPFEVDFACVRYSGPGLECLNLSPGQTLEQFMVAFDKVFCDLSSAEDGIDGDSAYQIWLNLGNTGTEQDFIDSLQGQDGNFIQVTAEPAGVNCANGGILVEVVSGADGTTILDSQYVCNGTDGTTPAVEENFYEEFIGDIQVSSGLPNPAIYHFPTGYEILTYTNTSGVSKDYIVHVSYDILLNLNNSEDMSHWVDGAIVKTVGAVDTVQYESLGTMDMLVGLYDGPTVGDIININSIPDTVNTTPGNNPVEARFGSMVLPRNVSFFKKVTLLNGETVSLKFKTKDVTSESLLKKAQIFVNEL